MWIHASINAYDCMTEVIVNARVTVTSSPPAEHEEEVTTYRATIPGCGECSPSLWLQDALVALIETL